MRIISVLVENKPRVLARVAGLFARRGFNIHSLAVAPTDNPALSRMTIVAFGDDRTTEQMTKQLNKLINVIKVVELSESTAVSRELMLIQVQAAPETRAQLIEISDVFRAKVVDVGADSLIIECTGTPDKIHALEDLLRPYGIIEMTKTGRIALQRGPKVKPARVIRAANKATA
ncbi:MAG: acetolactate synthase small subunit [Acidimicrobiia bacterium]